MFILKSEHHLCQGYGTHECFAILINRYCLFLFIFVSIFVLNVCAILRNKNLLNINTLRRRQEGSQFLGIFKCILLNENIWISIEISPKLVSKGPINYIPALVQIMSWRRPGDKPLSEPVIVRLLTHTSITRSRWVKRLDCFTEFNTQSVHGFSSDMKLPFYLTLLPNLVVYVMCMI